MAIPENYIDKITKDGDSRDICPAADKVRVDNDNFEGTDLDAVLDEVAASEDGKVDKVTGKGLSTNDYTTAEKNKLAGLSNYDDTALAARVTYLEGRKRYFIEFEPDNQGNPRLEDQDGNFLTADEFIAIVQRPDLHEVQMYYEGRVYYFDLRYDQGDSWRFWAVESERKRYMIIDRDDSQFGLNFEVHNDMINASDIETGLESQFMTQSEKDKLGGIAAGAQVNVKADWNASSGDAQILNKPTIPAAQVQPDWNAASGMGAILNKPTIPTKTSDLTNDSGFITSYTETDPTVPNWAKQPNKPTYTPQEVGALPASTPIPSKTSDLTNDSGFINKSVFAGTCTTAAATMPKVCTVDTFKTTTSGGVTHAADRTMIAVMFTNSDTNTSAAPTLNVNNIGAKAIYYSNAKITSTAKNTIVAGTAKTLAYYYYDASLDDGNGAWVYMGKSVDSNNTYSNASLGQGYAVQSNSAAATAITASISSYALTANGIVSIKFTYDVPANATLNISSKGAKAIYYQGAPIEAGVIKAGDTATMIYSTYYHVISIDRSEGGSAGIVETTHAALAAARDDDELVPGTWYRITDYACTTTQDDTQSAGHQFDILVLATSPNTLSEEARAIRHTGDTYFANSNLEAWKIWYSLDNDTTRFAWADETNGKGVIYRMIDEWNNDCPYDFKNIQFKRKLVNDNGYYEYDPDNGTDTWVYTFAANEYDIQEDDWGGLLDGSLESPYQHMSDEGGGTFHDNIIKPYISVYNDDEDINFAGLRYLNDNVFIGYYEVNGNGDYQHPYCSYSNTFGSNCHSNTFGDGCSSNTLGNDCSSNTFGSNCYYNTFGNDCNSNTFGNGCHSNTFGNGCNSNTLGNGCHSNTFGNGCNSNTFGNSYYSNTFGNDCSLNTFGSNCYYNTFGNGCYSNTFGKNYTQYIIVENGNKKITLTSTNTPTYNTPLRNITISQGVNNTNTTKTISHNTLNDTFRTTYVATNSVEVQV